MQNLTGSDPLQSASAIHAKLLLSGLVRSIIIEPSGASRSIVVVADGPPERMLRVEAKNEALLALLDGRVVATVPENICPFSRELSRPVNIEDIHLGQPLDVFTLPTPRRWYAPEALTLVNPRNHGYAMDPIAVEDHQGGR